MTNGRKVTSMRFYAYHLMVRDNSSILLDYRQLFHQFVVDIWAKIESERLLYIRNNHYSCNFWCTFGVQVSAVSCTSRLRHDNQQSSRTVTDSCWCGSRRAVFLTRPTVRSVIACRFTKWTVCICAWPQNQERCLHRCIAMITLLCCKYILQSCVFVLLTCKCGYITIFAFQKEMKGIKKCVECCILWALYSGRA